MQAVNSDRTLRVVFGLVMGVAVATIHVSTASAVPMTNESPTNGNFSYEGSGSGYSNPNDMAKHLLIASNHGDVESVRLGLYFNNGSPKTVNIVNANQGDGGICRATGDGNRPLPTSDFIEIKFTDYKNSSNQTTYTVRGSDVCNSFMGNNQPNQAHSKFYGSFQTPNSTLDNDTGKYSVKMVIKFINIASLPDTPGNDQAVSFKVIGPGGSLVGNIDTNQTNQSNPNNSTLAKRVGNPGGVTHRFAFALSCNITDKSDEQVSLYDADNGMQPGGNVKYYVATVKKDGTEAPLKADEYVDNGSGNEDQPTPIGGSIHAFQPKPGTSRTARITIKNMDPSLKYVLVVKNVHGGGQPNLPTASNFIYVGLPGDSIYGADNYDCPGWDATPKTQVSPSTVKPGDTIRWTHTVDNDGPDKTTKDIDWEIRQYVISGGTSGPESVVETGTINQPKPKSLMLTKLKPYIAKSSDVGKKICQKIRIKPEALNSNVWQSSTPKCAKVAINGDFIPSVQVFTEAAEPGTSYDWHAQVTDGVIPVSDWPDAESYLVNAVASTKPGHTYSRQTLKESEIKWEVHKIIYKPTDNSVYNNASTLQFVCPGNTDCFPIGTSPDHANGKPPDGSGGTVNLDRTDILESNLAAGSRICYVSSVYLPPQLGAPEAHTYLDHYDPIWSYHADSDGSGPDTSYWYISGYTPIYLTDYHQRYVSSRDWRHSEYDCITVAKRPRLQVLGGDLSVGGLIRVGTSNYADPPKKTFGSWVEYAALSGGVNKFMASGAALSGGKDPIVNRAAWSHLTFANTDDTAYGNFSLLSDAPQLREYYSSRIGGGWTGGSLGTQHGIYSAGSVTLSGTGISGSIVIVSSGTVTIDGDISYNNGPYSSFEALPQVIIIAHDIIITKDVKNIDAWLVTTGSEGSIITCNEVAVDAALSNAICNNKLTVNGPVMTSNLYLRRTAGAKNESTRGDPAEVFNFRPDAYLWAYHQNLTTTGSTPRTVELTELPPRY